METTMIAVATLPAKTYMPDDDTALLQASRGGDVAAFEQLVKRYDAKLLRIAQKVTQNPEDAEEVVQEAFFKAYQKLDQFQEHAKFSTWLIRITLNESLMKLRKQRAILKQLVDNDVDADSERRLFDVADWTPNPEMLYRASEFREILITSLQRLSPALKVVFVLRDIEEHSLLETSEILNLTETAVKTRLSRARLQLREELSKYFKQPE
jgi:RNA polymerase sigma-70 factor (ECF subfamily)